MLHKLLLCLAYYFVGQEPDTKTLKEMVAEAPGPINFTVFLGMLGDRLKGDWNHCYISVQRFKPSSFPPFPL